MLIYKGKLYRVNWI